MEIVNYINADQTTDRVIITSVEELRTIIQSCIAYQFDKGQINVHLKDNGELKLSRPMVVPEQVFKGSN